MFLIFHYLNAQEYTAPKSYNIFHEFASTHELPTDRPTILYSTEQGIVAIPTALEIPCVQQMVSYICNGQYSAIHALYKERLFVKNHQLVGREVFSDIKNMLLQRKYNDALKLIEECSQMDPFSHVLLSCRLDAMAYIYFEEQTFEAPYMGLLEYACFAILMGAQRHNPMISTKGWIVLGLLERNAETARVCCNTAKEYSKRINGVCRHGITAPSYLFKKMDERLKEVTLPLSHQETLSIDDPVSRPSYQETRELNPRRVYYRKKKTSHSAE